MDERQELAKRVLKLLDEGSRVDERVAFELRKAGGKDGERLTLRQIARKILDEQK